MTPESQRMFPDRALFMCGADTLVRETRSSQNCRSMNLRPRALTACGFSPSITQIPAKPVRKHARLPMLEVIKHVLVGQNQLAASGLLLMIVGGLGVYLHAVPRTLWDWFTRQTTMMITVKDDDAAFTWVKEWFLDQKFLKRMRRLDLDTTLRGEKLALIPAPGQHWFWYGGRPFQVFFYRSQETKGWSPRRVEALTFRTIGRQQSFLKAFVDEIVDSHQKRMGKVSCLYTYDEGWDRSAGYISRSLDSVILPAGETERLVADVAKFKAARHRYRQLGVPYHRGYLFYGPPGTGKTSLVSALGAKFGLSIYALNLAAFNDRTLMGAVNDVPSGSIVLFEDIDCMETGEARPGSSARPEKRGEGPDKPEKADPFGVTLSGLLNVLDGFHAPDGVLFVMTSNRIDALDLALLRPGRIDYKLFLGPATFEQKVELYRRFFPAQPDLDAVTFVDSHEAKTMAEFQGLLLQAEEETHDFGAENPSSANEEESVMA